MLRVEILHYLPWLGREKLILKKTRERTLTNSFNTLKTLRVCAVAKLVANFFL